MFISPYFLHISSYFCSISFTLLFAASTVYFSGLSKMLVLVCSFTLRTVPLASEMVYIICHISQVDHLMGLRLDCLLLCFEDCHLWRSALSLSSSYTVRICCSQTPPWWEAAGILKIYFMPFFRKAFSVFKSMWLVQGFNGLSQLLFCTNEICAVIGAHDDDLASSAYKSAQGVDPGSGVETVCYLYMHCPDGEIGKHCTIPLDSSPALFKIKGSKIIDC